MTTYEQSRLQQQIDINPFMIFVIFMLLPYLLFFTLLVLLTGQHDLMLLYASVIDVSDTVYFKAWMIGSFLLSCSAAMILGGQRTKAYLLALWVKNRPMHLSEIKTEQEQCFLIEELPNQPEKIPERHRELESILDNGIPGTDHK